MKAVQFKKFGGPEVLEYRELPIPQRGTQSAVVQIKAASVNPSDVKNLSGHFKQTIPPRVPGRDFSGVVVDGPPQWRDAEVWGTGGDIGFTRNGTHAEYLELPLDALVRKPQSLSHREASAIGVNFVVAWLGAMHYAKLIAGETIAVVGAGGGVGGAVVQIAKAQGCRVIAIDRSPLTAGSPAAHLADHALPLDADAAAAVHALTGGGADVVYDTVGGVAFEMALGLPRRRGRVVEISGTGRRRVEFDLVDFYHNETQLFGADSAQLGVAEAAPIMSLLVEGFDTGRFEAPRIASVFALEHAGQAYRAVQGGTRGRVVLEM